MGEQQINNEQLLSQTEKSEDKTNEIMTSNIELLIEERDKLSEEVKQLNDKYMRLYAEFENYKKRVLKDKEEVIKYANEEIIYQLLAVIDSLELALKHATNENVPKGFIEGVEFTLKELKKILGNFGLSTIESEGKPFDPSVHHAMTQVERDDLEENMVVEEMRKGYMLRDKVLRPALVAVSKKRVNTPNKITKEQQNL